MADWSELPFDVLNEIVMRFETIKDLVYFSVVCRPWNYFATTFKHELNVKTTPWMLLAEDTKDNPHCLRKVFNPCNNKCYKLELPEVTGCRFWGSAYGWIVTYNQDLDLHLFNPLSKDSMPLPPVSRLPHKWVPHVSVKRDEDFVDGAVDALMKRSFISKVFVLKVAEDDFIVFITYGFGHKKLAFARPGDESWIFIDQPGPTMADVDLDYLYMSNCAVDVVCDGARILILYENASLGYVDISDLSDHKKFVVKDYIPKYPMILSDPQNLGLKAREYVPAPEGILKGLQFCFFGLYLVNSCGDLLMVIRDRWHLFGDGEEPDYVTFRFKVYQLNFVTKKWSQVHHLNDVALFLGDHSSMSIPTIGAGNLKSNSIYFSDDASDLWDLIPAGGGEDMGVFNLEKGEPEDIYAERDKYSRFQTPVWFIPKF